jgi:hypothetical protein
MPLQALQLVLPKKKAKAGGISSTPTYKPGQEKLSLPAYRDHLTDLFSTRQANDSRTLMNDLARHDSDVSAAFFAYQSIAGSADYTVKAFDLQGQISPDGIAIANQVLERLTTVTDYSLGFSAKPSLRSLNDDMRFWTLLRGTPGAELILDKKFEPDTIRLIDMMTIEWHEKNVGVYKPVQKASNQIIDLDIPTFFTARFNQNPADVYSYSPFVAAINTIATRVQVINELYRITQVVGYPRMDVQVLEEVLLKSAPPLLRTDHKATRQFIDGQMAQIRATFQNMRADETLVHTDAVKVDMVNDSRPGTSLPISAVIDVLNEQNLAALKTMPAVIGKSNNGQVASTEARLFALNCDALNRVVADIWSQVLTLAVRLAGFQGRVVFEFESVELRPVLELEPQKTMKQSRLEQALSRGYITDDEFHIDVFGRPRPASAPELSGTNFAQPQPAASVDPSQQSPNGDSLGRGMAPEGGTKQAKSNTVKSGAGKTAPNGK